MGWSDRVGKDRFINNQSKTQSKTSYKGTSRALKEKRTTLNVNSRYLFLVFLNVLSRFLELSGRCGGPGLFRKVRGRVGFISTKFRPNPSKGVQVMTNK